MKVSAGSYDSALQGRKERETQKKNEDKREREREIWAEPDAEVCHRA